MKSERDNVASILIPNAIGAVVSEFVVLRQ
jgi:hypothetical protein